MKTQDTQAQVLENAQDTQTIDTDTQAVDTQAQDTDTQAEQTRGELSTDPEKRAEQIQNALFNGNNKKQNTIPQGWHKLEHLRNSKLWRDKIPADLPAEAVAVFMASANIVAYSTPDALCVNTNAIEHLQPIQAGALDWLKEQAQGAGLAIVDVAIDWRGRGGANGGKTKTLEQRAKTLFK